MENQVPPNITSFLIRFVHTEPGAPSYASFVEEISAEESAGSAEKPDGNEDHTGSEAPAYRGTIRHIPSGEELTFNRWQHAVEFIRRFIPLDSEALPRL